MHRRESAGRIQHDLPVPKHQAPEWISTEANLGKNSLTSQKLGAETDHEAHHCKTAVPLLSEGGETKFCVVHGEESRVHPL